MKVYISHAWTCVLALLSLAIVGFVCLYRESESERRKSFSGKYVVTGWPLTYRTQFLKDDAFGTTTDGPPRGVTYFPWGEAEVDQSAYWTDVGIVVIVGLIPATLCGWFLSCTFRNFVKF